MSLTGSQLFADFNGKGHIPMVAMSERMFSPRLLGAYEFWQWIPAGSPFVE
ncbi:MAG TPA: hypothetical protein VJT80_20845 [Steroidobacteraceae bacterium]|nr:hypothetical protein [Steroidobacteraceae bacterium]